MRLNILIADRHDIYREGLAQYLSELSFISEVEKVNCGKNLDAILHKFNTDILFFDISTLNGETIDIAREVKLNFPDIKIIAMSFSESVYSFDRFMEVGIDGYIIKSLDSEIIEQAVKKVSRGGRFFTDDMLIKLVNKEKKQYEIKEAAGFKLTNREMQLLQYFLKGYGRQEISSVLNISEKTVDKHKENILRKTKMKNMILLALFAQKNGLV